MTRKCVTLMFLVALQIFGCDCLKNVRLKGETVVKAGDSLILECDYDLEGAPLYSIKWYFGNEEFYRFVPKESPPTRVFAQPDISVDLQHSDNKTVILTDMKRTQTGFYKCEISADAPLFHTDIKSTLVIVIEIPQESPKLLAERTKFPRNEMIKAVCSSGKSYPAANLTWYINGAEVNTTRVTRLSYVVTAESGGCESSKSKLEIPLPSVPNVFVDGKLKLRCRAHQFDIYSNYAEMEIPDDSPTLAHVLSPVSAANFGYVDDSIKILCLVIFGNKLLFI